MSDLSRACTTGEAPPVLFQWPSSARLGEVVAKSKIVAASPVRGLRERLREQVASVEWAYKLAPISLNMAASPLVPEVQVFRVTLKAGITSKLELLLRGIDQAIPSPVIFELFRDAGVCTVAAYKRPNEADVSKNVLGNYLWGRWLPVDNSRDPIPTALNIAGLYEQLLHTLIALAPRAGESLPDMLQRVENIHSLRRDMAKVVSRLATEKQFNRKVELNSIVRGLKQNLKLLEGSK